MKDFPIGTIVNYRNEAKLTVVKIDKPLCNGCYFSNGNRYLRPMKGEISCYKHGMLCTSHLRKDKNHVIFKLKEKL